MGHRSRRRKPFRMAGASGVDTATTSGTRPVFFQKEQELLHLEHASIPVIADLRHWEY